MTEPVPPEPAQPHEESPAPVVPPILNPEDLPPEGLQGVSQEQREQMNRALYRWIEKYVNGPYRRTPRIVPPPGDGPDSEST